MRARHGVPAGYLPHPGGWLRHTTSPRCPERGRRRKPAEAERRLLPRTQQQLPAGPRDCRLPGGRRLSALCPRDGGAKNLSLYLRGRRMQCGTGRRASPAGSAFSPSEVIVTACTGIRPPCSFGGLPCRGWGRNQRFAHFAHFLSPLKSVLTPKRCLRHILVSKKRTFADRGPPQSGGGAANSVTNTITSSERKKGAAASGLQLLFVLYCVIAGRWAL